MVALALLEFMVSTVFEEGEFVCFAGENLELDTHSNFMEILYICHFS